MSDINKGNKGNKGKGVETARKSSGTFYLC